ncbi:MAG: biopolymer transporter ExbD, partial [Bacteroidales bacterium]|nr:biopolymer transporter ExbD [Bacteroidales bacterium]
NEADKTKMLVVLKIDRDTKMGVVTDVKQALRRASALKIMYANTNVDKIVLQ